MVGVVLPYFECRSIKKAGRRCNEVRCRVLQFGPLQIRLLRASAAA